MRLARSQSPSPALLCVCTTTLLINFWWVTFVVVVAVVVVANIRVGAYTVFTCMTRVHVLGGYGSASV